MPLFEFKCPKCGKIVEFFEKTMKDKAPTCTCDCGEKMVQVYGSFYPSIFKPITLTNLSDKPEHFETKKALRKRCKELGVYSKAVD